MVPRKTLNAPAGEKKNRVSAAMANPDDYQAATSYLEKKKM